MGKQQTTKLSQKITNINELATLVDYSLMDTLVCDPDATQNGDDYAPRQVFSGHYVPVKPTAIANHQYIAHSKALFNDLGFDDDLAIDEDFGRLFSGDLSNLPEPIRPFGWATGYALSIYGTEYVQQCPFQTGNAYGDGRAISVLEVLAKGKRWEMQLKGGGRTPYCRGGDGRAVLRSSVREFLAQEHMHALGVPTSRSLCLFLSATEKVNRPWYSEGSKTRDPDILVANPVAISTRVAPSFLRVGQLELFARRARNNAHANALNELKKIVLHLIEREYRDEIDDKLGFEEQVVLLATAFRKRLIALVAHWMRVGYCQGNFNSDNCACGGYTLDYGPFGFVERFDPFYQPWTGGGRHFSFFNQSAAAKENFGMFCRSLLPLLTDYPEAAKCIEVILAGFSSDMQIALENMWAAKLGMQNYDEALFHKLLSLMVSSGADYTMFFCELSKMPDKIASLSHSFYQALSAPLLEQWESWLDDWRASFTSDAELVQASELMKQVNPKYTWREWLVVPAYEEATNGDYKRVHDLQWVLTQPYGELSKDIDGVHYQLRPAKYDALGGVNHYSCSS
ncbi:protein adenylyltransferase SelO family protein [Agaribacter flavus]|uniref:Protein nucleotidyltransferase YdiU n=1 Tax=Agaribacter flavus TaxID=1902781 RepID=A0ABV7FUT4_9ALTE